MNVLFKCEHRKIKDAVIVKLTGTTKQILNGLDFFDLKNIRFRNYDSYCVEADKEERVYYCVFVKNWLGRYKPLFLKTKTLSGSDARECIVENYISKDNQFTDWIYSACQIRKLSGARPFSDKECTYFGVFNEKKDAESFLASLMYEDEEKNKKKVVEFSADIVSPILS